MTTFLVILSVVALFLVYGLFVRCDCDGDHRCGQCPFSEMHDS